MTWPTGCWVSSPYDQRETMEETYRRAAQAAKVLILQGPEAAANQFNRK